MVLVLSLGEVSSQLMTQVYRPAKRFLNPGCRLLCSCSLRTPELFDAAPLRLSSSSSLCLIVSSETDSLYLSLSITHSPFCFSLSGWTLICSVQMKLGGSTESSCIESSCNFPYNCLQRGWQASRLVKRANLMQNECVYVLDGTAMVWRVKLKLEDAD